jgi:L-alanine-DL-glutamate epimerase-like enolase superfamily enzyme
MSTRLQLSVRAESWTTRNPYRITGHIWNSNDVIVVELSDGEFVARGEGMPVYYLDETVDSLSRQVESVASHIEGGVTRADLQHLMSAGGARNAVDCALWALEAKRNRRSIWDLTNIRPRPVTTTFTIGIEQTPEAMAARATEAALYPFLKIKLNEQQPVERVSAIRAARPDARLTVDANQGWSFEQLREVAPALARLDVKLIEQPLPRGADACLEGYTSPVPLCGDESCQHRGELSEAIRRYQVINVKLDKSGGLTEALLLSEQVRRSGRQLLVSCMGGTSLAMAPGFVVAQLCDYVELDGPLLLRRDRIPPMHYHRGMIDVPDSCLWA